MSAETYRFPSQLTIRSITDQHHNLLSKIDGSQSLTLDIPDDAEIDISFLQLLESARLYAQSAGKTLDLKSPASAALLDALTRCGWLTNNHQDTRRFWLHEGGVQ